MIRTEWIQKEYEAVSTQGLVLSFFAGLEPSFCRDFSFDAPAFASIKPMLEHGDFSGAYGEADWGYTTLSQGPKRVFLLGLGRKQDFSLVRLRALSALLARVIRKQEIKEFATAIHGKVTDIPPAELCEAIVTGTKMGLYHFSHTLTLSEKKYFDIETIRIVDGDEDMARYAEPGITRGSIISNAVCRTRDMVNLPANIVTPGYFVNKAKKMSLLQDIACNIYNERDIRSMGLSGLYAIGKGAAEPPYFIDIRYRGGDGPPVVLIGKGVTFDSGGISLKQGKGMYRMKDDMAGAAIVLNTIQAAAQLGIPLNIYGLLPLCENLPSRNAVKPGDVVKAMNGLNVEIVDTDAEGRIILMDALCYGERLKPAFMLDVATLTGAVTVALGRYAIGAMSNSGDLMQLLLRTGKEIDERLWPLPLWECYKSQLQTPVADIKNLGGREAGAITAGVFLSYFVGRTPWAHLDIASVSWLDQETPLALKGASATGLRLLLRLLEHYAAGRPEFSLGEFC